MEEESSLGINSQELTAILQALVFELLGYLKSQQIFRVGQTVLFQGVRVVIERFVNDIVAVVRSFENEFQGKEL